MHYGVGVVPARPYKPRDKAKVESGVQIVERWIIAALRHHRFFTLAEMNVEIRRLLERLNNRPFRKREGSRTALFAAVDEPALRPLPLERFDLSQWSRAKVNIFCGLRSFVALIPPGAARAADRALSAPHNWS